MAIEGLEAIDAASLATAASAKDGSQATFLSREEWRRSRQGKKVDRRHCGIGDRGAAVIRPDQAIEEAAWSGRPTEPKQGERGDPACRQRRPVASLTVMAPAAIPARRAESLLAAVPWWDVLVLSVVDVFEVVAVDLMIAMRGRTEPGHVLL
jgi:hypothetical protein